MISDGSWGTIQYTALRRRTNHEDDLPEIIHMGREKGFTFFQLNTNGIRLAREEGYAGKLKKQD